jgi:hypothetical protein
MDTKALKTERKVERSRLEQLIFKILLFSLATIIKKNFGAFGV